MNIQKRFYKARIPISISALIIILISCQPKNITPPVGTPNTLTTNADDLMIVDCLLPGQIRKLGKMTYQAQRRPIRTTAQDCSMRGGEYIAYNQSTSQSALKIWMPKAQTGDEVAQTYVGEIFQRGLGTPPRYDLAAEWYLKAAKQGYARAQMSLGFLYEKGLGVEKDSSQALSWYRKAIGLSDEIAIHENSLSLEERKELENLRQEAEKHKVELRELRRQLDFTRNELEQTRQELYNRENKILHEKKQLEEERDQLQKKIDAAEVSSEELQTIEHELLRRVEELQRKDHELNRLRKEIESQENEVFTYRTKLASYEKKLAELPEPFIEINDPQVLATRGVRIAPVIEGIKGRHIAGRVWAPAGLANFTINDKKEKVETDGKFKVWIPMRSIGETDVKIDASDTQGKMASVRFKLKPELTRQKKASKKAPVKSIDFGTYYALIIGNNEYTDLPKLESAVNDVRKVSEVLEGKYGFTTTVLENATRYEILNSLNQFLAKLTEKDNFLLYYAGHGELDTKNRRGYWLPVDALSDNSVDWIPTYMITDLLHNMSAKQIIVVADTCYSGILTRSVITKLKPGMSDQERYNFLKIMANKHSRMVLSSGELKPVLDTGTGEHSVFAQAFIQVLESNEDILEGWSLYNQVSKFVTYASERIGMQQVPQYAALIQGGHESGDFFFVPTN